MRQREAQSVKVPRASLEEAPAETTGSSRRLVDQERDLARLECEVHKPVPLMYRMATERLAQKDVPVRLPLLIHVLLDLLGDL